jgi:hypothetical protein
MEGVKQANNERGTRTQAAPGWKIPVMMDFKTLFETEMPQTLPHRWVRDLINGLAILDARINDPEFVIEERRQVPRRDVAVLIYAGRDYLTAVMPVPRRVIRPTAEE